MDEVKTTAAPLSIDRAAVLAELEALPAPAPVVAEEPSAPEPQEAPEGETEDKAPEPEAEEVEEQEAAPAEEPAAAAPADPELDKRLEAINRQERRAKEGIAKERAEIERQLEEWAPRIQQAQAFEALRNRARYDLPRVLQELGLTADDFEPAAKQLYAHSKAAESQPALREQAARNARERETYDRIAAVEKQNQALLQRLEQQTIQERTQAYLNEVTAAVGDDAPTVKTLLTNDKQEAIAQLSQVAYDLLESTGETPDPADVVRELEKIEVARARKRGFAPTTKTTTPAAEEKRTATRTLSTQLSQTTTPPRNTPKSRKEEITDVLAALESGRTE